MKKYTMSRCRKDNTLYGSVHSGNGWQKTDCGMVVNENWWIISTPTDRSTCPHCKKDITAKVTCRKCQKILDKQA